MQIGYTTGYYFYNRADTEKTSNFLKKLIVCISSTPDYSGTTVTQTAHIPDIPHKPP